MVRLGDSITQAVVDDLKRRIAPPPIPPLTDARRRLLGGRFEACGFLRAVAGDADFDRLLDAFNICVNSPRGIILTGRNGVGKTKALDALWSMLRREDNAWIDCNDPEHVAWLRRPSTFHGRDVFLDDLGAERFMYGDEDVVGTFICAWHARNPDNRLFVTSNLDSAAINERYGGRVLERIAERCVICALTGTTKRHATVV